MPALTLDGLQRDARAYLRLHYDDIAAGPDYDMVVLAMCGFAAKVVAEQFRDVAGEKMA